MTAVLVLVIAIAAIVFLKRRYSLAVAVAGGLAAVVALWVLSIGLLYLLYWIEPLMR